MPPQQDIPRKRGRPKGSKDGPRPPGAPKRGRPTKAGPEEIGSKDDLTVCKEKWAEKGGVEWASVTKWRRPESIQRRGSGFKGKIKAKSRYDESAKSFELRWPVNLKTSKLKPSSLKTPQPQKPFKVSLEQASMTKPFKAKPSSFKPLLYPVNAPHQRYQKSSSSQTRISDVPTTLTVAQKRAPVSTSNDWRSVTVSRGIFAFPIS
ncbi:hypothetical protein B0H13DRAFT_1850722 [Mycena leptocephala]|nr:hypothetical protein B0H13DRAFT_1850722 [Mycena leptocephala]